MKTKRGSDMSAALLLRAAVIWAICAAALLLPSAAVLTMRPSTVQTLSYVSAGISFLAAFAAGITAGKGRRSRAFSCALLTALVLIAALLTAGFMIRGEAPEPAGVLSVTSFTLAGCISGGLLFSSAGKTRQWVSVKA